jgi:glycerol kinase
MAGTSGNILALDQGTTYTSVLLVDTRRAVVAEAARSLPPSYPQPVRAALSTHQENILHFLLLPAWSRDEPYSACNTLNQAE